MPVFTGMTALIALFAIMTQSRMPGWFEGMDILFCNSSLHDIHQFCIVTDDFVFDLICGYTGEEFACAINFVFFNLPQFH